METIGNRIKKYRDALKLTQEEVGKFCGVSSVAVGRWESDEYHPSGKSLTKLAKKLRISSELIMEGKSTTAQINIHNSHHEHTSRINAELLAKSIDDIEVLLEISKEKDISSKDKAELYSARYEFGENCSPSDVAKIIKNYIKEK